MPIARAVPWWSDDWGAVWGGGLRGKRLRGLAGKTCLQDMPLEIALSESVE